MSLPILRLAKNEERRLRSGHLWIYSNEVDKQASPLKSFTPGEQVLVESSQGKTMGVAYVNPQSLICARLLSSGSAEFDRPQLIARIRNALALREQLFAHPCYRLIYGESDLLPGLVVDRFGDHLSVQLNTAGMEAMKDRVIEALIKVLSPKSILLRNDAGVRQLEGLPSEVLNAYGEVPETVELIENGVRFLAPLASGQKTGWFYDQRPNREWLRPLVPGKRVLDVFSYVGSFGVQAASFGAADVVCSDISAKALDMVHENATLNGVADKVSSIEGDAFTAMKSLKEADERFDVIIVDPPAFIKRKKDQKEGILAYRRIYELAMRLLNNGGYLISGSCSMHMPREELLEVIRAGSRHIDRHAQILAEGMQGADHPVHPAIPETRYLKAVLSRISHS
ncbi:class I SAM-dependent rRNA methyltransferase [Spongiibacter taiwanensis]|uniref:class I SAM-dependent rRNA methyltransferase n=1 Tax=Spongiibacter taiwanensis TaxID=1748242 RepID=UPI002036429A|nr:class I SAM-dependent rRNA methyltransferase [Spongiibacter taiwanensis]USA42184.1 class I SAM-dependent rRNA methyltransferase [Spongiibacter taiwanensis]